MLNFSKGRFPFGAFVGVGYEFINSGFIEDFKNLGYSTSGLFLNLGLSQTIADSHKIDLTFRIPFYKYVDAISAKLDTTAAVTIGYSYTF